MYYNISLGGDKIKMIEKIPVITGTTLIISLAIAAMLVITVSAQPPPLPPSNDVIVNAIPESQTGLPGNIVSFTVNLMNNGSVPDIIVVDSVTDVPAGWTVELKDTGVPQALPYSTPLIQNKTSYPLTLDVHIPADATAGTYSMCINIRSCADPSEFDSATVSVEVPLPPIANANGPYTGVIEYIAVPITFDGTGSYDPDGTIEKYEWDLDDDGNFDDAFGATPTVSFTAPGLGNIHLKVTDNNGATDTDTTTLTITKQSPPPDGIHSGLLTPPEQPQCYSGTSKIQGKGNFTIDERIQDWATAIDTSEHMEGTGEFEMDSKTVLDQAANTSDFYDPNFYHKKTMQFQGNATNRLINREKFESSGIFGGTGTRINEYFDVSEIQKDESSSIKTISAPGSGQSHRFATMDDFSGIWGIDSDWQKICQKDIRHHQMFMGNFSVQKDLTFEREVVMP
jgi:hypothetical protein